MSKLKDEETVALISEVVLHLQGVSSALLDMAKIAVDLKDHKLWDAISPCIKAQKQEIECITDVLDGHNTTCLLRLAEERNKPEDTTTYHESGCFCDTCIASAQARGEADEERRTKES